MSWKQQTKEQKKKAKGNILTAKRRRHPSEQTKEYQADESNNGDYELTSHEQSCRGRKDGKRQKATGENTSAAPWRKRQTSLPSATYSIHSVIEGRFVFQRLNISNINLTTAITPGEAAAKAQSPRKEKKKRKKYKS